MFYKSLMLMVLIGSCNDQPLDDRNNAKSSAANSYKSESQGDNSAADTSRSTAPLTDLEKVSGSGRIENFPDDGKYIPQIGDEFTYVKTTTTYQQKSTGLVEDSKEEVFVEKVESIVVSEDGSYATLTSAFYDENSRPVLLNSYWVTLKTRSDASRSLSTIDPGPGIIAPYNFGFPLNCKHSGSQQTLYKKQIQKQTHLGFKVYESDNQEYSRECTYSSPDKLKKVYTYKTKTSSTRFYSLQRNAVNKIETCLAIDSTSADICQTAQFRTVTETKISSMKRSKNAPSVPPKTSNSTPSNKIAGTLSFGDDSKINVLSYPSYIMSTDARITFTLDNNGLLDIEFFGDKAIIRSLAHKGRAYYPDPVAYTLCSVSSRSSDVIGAVTLTLKCAKSTFYDHSTLYTFVKNNGVGTWTRQNDISKIIKKDLKLDLNGSESLEFDVRRQGLHP